MGRWASRCRVTDLPRHHFGPLLSELAALVMFPRLLSLLRDIPSEHRVPYLVQASLGHCVLLSFATLGAMGLARVLASFDQTPRAVIAGRNLAATVRDAEPKMRGCPTWNRTVARIRIWKDYMEQLSLKE